MTHDDPEDSDVPTATSAWRTSSSATGTSSSTHDRVSKSDSTDTDESEPSWAPVNCPNCGHGPLITHAEEAVCPSCERTYEPRDICTDCGGRIDHTSDPPYCEACGLVVEESPELQSQHRWEDARDNERTGPAESETRRNRSQTTAIGSFDEVNVSLSSTQRDRIQRLKNRQQQFRTYGSAERSAEYAMNELSRLTPALGLPERVRETAAVIYRQAANAELHIGRSVEAVATAALYFASKQENMYRPVDKLIAVSRVDQSSINNAIRILSRELGLKMQPSDPEQYISQYADELSVSGETERTAKQLLEGVESQNALTGSPTTLAAAALYRASLSPEAQQLTQDDVAEATDASLSAISAAYRKFRSTD